MRLSQLFGAGPRLATRIALTVIVPLVVIQLINLGLFLLLPKPTLHLYRNEWLIETSAGLARSIFALPQDARAQALTSVPAAEWLDLAWQTTAAHPEHGSNFRNLPPELASIEADLRRDLGGAIKSIAIQSLGPPDFIPMRANMQLIPPDGAPAGVDAQPQRHRLGIPDFFDIRIEGSDGTWLSITPKKSADRYLRAAPFVLGLVASGLLIAVLSTFAARQILRRLEKMAAAAERMGREREPTLISETGLGEFAIIARSLNEMQVRLKRFIDERTRMVAAISHDLRTPLTRMKLVAEYIENTEAKHEIIDGIDRMQTMIEATLTFASHDARGETHVKTDLAALIISLVDDMSDMGHDVVYDGPDHYLQSCQPQMIGRAVGNLLDNAMKFGSSATIRLRSDESTTSIVVDDDGPGIPATKLSTVLEPFYRVETSRNEETGGFGLGLSIANDIVLAHGGRMTLGNKQPKGLVVRISLPLKEAA